MNMLDTNFPPEIEDLTGQYQFTTTTTSHVLDIERLDNIDTEVFVTVAAEIKDIEWRLSDIDNKLGVLSGHPRFADAQSIRRHRYGMGTTSSAPSTAGRVSPSSMEPGQGEAFAIGTPSHTPEPHLPYGSGASVPGGDMFKNPFTIRSEDRERLEALSLAMDRTTDSLGEREQTSTR